MSNTAFINSARGYFEVAGTPSAGFLSSLPADTIEVTVRPASNFEWVDGTWVEGAPPPPPTEAEIRARIAPISRMQFAIALASTGVITAAEAKAFAPGNALPQMASNAIAASGMSDTQKLEAEIKALAADSIRRTNPIVAMMQAVAGLSDEAVDTLFITAAGIE